MLSPLSWIVLLFLAAWLSRNPRRKKRFLLTAVALLLVFTNPMLRNLAFRQWEVPGRSAETIRIPYDIGIVLGGPMRYYNDETGRVVYGHSVDRLLQALALYREGKIKKILLTGGSGFLWRPDLKEAVYLGRVLREADVPAEDILMETESRNTYENARQSAAFIRERNPAASCLLITSAYHMRRSMACFKMAGVPVQPFAVDQYAGRMSLLPDGLILPDAFNLDAWDILLHEMAGYAVYRMMGYL